MNEIIQQIQNFASDNAQNLYQRICDAKEKKAEEKDAPESYKSYLYLCVLLILLVLGMFLYFVVGDLYLVSEDGEDIEIVDAHGLPRPMLILSFYTIYVGIRFAISNRNRRKHSIALYEKILSKVAYNIELANKDWDNLIFSCIDKVQAIINSSSLPEEKKEELLQKSSCLNELCFMQDKLRDVMFGLDRNANYITNCEEVLKNYAAWVKLIYTETAEKQIEVYREIESVLNESRL